MIQPSYGGYFSSDMWISSILPRTTTATALAYALEIEVDGMNPNFRSFAFDWSRNAELLAKSLSIPKISITTSATFQRLKGKFLVHIPAQASITAGTYRIDFRLDHVFFGNYSMASTTFTVSPATTVRDLTFPSTIPISPNPVTDALTLALPENELHSVRLTNTLGCAVWTLSEASGTTTLDVGGLSAGVYFVEVQSARRRSVQKVVKY